MELLKLIPLELQGLALVIVVWVCKQLWESRKKAQDKESDLIQQNTIAIVQLTVEIKNFKDHLLSMNTRLDNSEKSLNALHEFKREIMKNGN